MIGNTITHIKNPASLACIIPTIIIIYNLHNYTSTVAQYLLNNQYFECAKTSHLLLTSLRQSCPVQLLGRINEYMVWSGWMILNSSIFFPLIEPVSRLATGLLGISTLCMASWLRLHLLLRLDLRDANHNNDWNAWHECQLKPQTNRSATWEWEGLSLQRIQPSPLSANANCCRSTTSTQHLLAYEIRIEAMHGNYGRVCTTIP